MRGSDESSRSRLALPLTVALAGVVLLAIGALPGDSAATADGVPNCRLGTLMTVGHRTAPEPGTPEWERLTFPTIEAAATDFTSRYLTVGRADGKPSSTEGFRDLGHGEFYIPLVGAPDRGEVLFEVEEVGRGSESSRYAVLRVEYCDGAQPREDFFAQG
jgi:hypothetical protein